MNTRTTRLLSGTAVLLLLGAPCAARAQSTAPGPTTTGPTTTGTPPTHHKLPPTTHMPNSAAAQNRELDQIGNKLLKETPEKPVNSTASEGGGLEPPTH